MERPSNSEGRVGSAAHLPLTALVWEFSALLAFVWEAAELMERLQIVGHTHQVPFQGNFLQPTQRELLKTQNPLNNPNDWFDAGLAA